MSDRMLPAEIAPCDVLAIAPHPDDAEIFCGGTLLRLQAMGKRVAILDLTRGEGGSRGTAVERDREAMLAAEHMKLAWRANLSFPDTAIEDSIAQRRLLAACIRRSRAAILFGPDDGDYHPDHVAAAQLVAAAWFLAGVGGAPIRETPHRPARYLKYLGNLPTEPQFLIDIGPVWERKVEVVKAYVSQLDTPGRSGSHFLQGTDILARMSARAVHFGLLGGVRYAEAFRSNRPYLLDPRGLD